MMISSQPQGVPPQLSPQDLSLQIKSFLSGSDPQHGQKLSPRDHARCALLLMRCLPSARHAVLEHLRSVFHDSVSWFLSERDSQECLPQSSSSQRRAPPPLSTPGLDEVTQEVQRVLEEFIKLNPRAWAPLISAWSIELMGQLSSKHANRQGMPHSASLNELLQLWMSCRATRVLMDIYTLCLSTMIDSCPDACVDALLDTSVQHSPHFDWVVAHIGNSFPSTIISRVLSCGLKDFCAHSSPAETPEKRVPKLGSVVGILGHLSSRHGNSIRQEILRMFHESLRPGSKQQRATLPYLLQLAALSSSLLGTVCQDLVDSLKPSTLAQLQQHCSTLPREELDNMLNLSVHLACQTSAGAPRLLRFLLDTAMPASVITTPGLAVHDSVREACDRIVRLLLLSLQKQVYGRTSGRGASEAQPRAVPFLDAMRGHLSELCAEMLRLERKRHLWIHQLLGLLCIYSNPPCAPEALCLLLTLAQSPEELGLAVQLHAVLSSSVQGLALAVVARSVSQVHAGALTDKRALQLLQNLALVVQNEEGGMGREIGAALSEHLSDFGQLLLHSNPGVCEAACLLLCCCPFPSSLPPAQLHLLIRSSSYLFFHSMHIRSSSGVSSASRLLLCLSKVSQAGRKAVLHQLVEGALHQGNAGLFGGQSTVPVSQKSDGATGSLLESNSHLGSTVDFSGSVWSVFHAGVIGAGLKPEEKSRQSGQEECAENTQSLISLLCCCCANKGEEDGQLTTLDPEAAKTLAVTITECACPDVTNGELAWPPEEHARTTVQRDLLIYGCFCKNPLLFQLLHVVAQGRPALCYCSVLLRGLLATLLAHWEASRESSSVDYPWHLMASCELVSCMGEGQILPPALTNMHEMFSLLAPYEVRLLLLSVWDFVRENGPFPQRFVFQAERAVFNRDFTREGDPAKYMGIVHSVLHRNIDRLGLLSGRFQV
ncbi:integrator complex subunit 5 isoform X2 [Rana temporaria]|nr:integrator complex subunit 5 isoform X2 [Rana temporaria]XP_040184874.1 integrator complex subunit 5 isoform X2 [Rana temporaria]